MNFEEYVAQRRHALFRFAVVLSTDPVLAQDLVADVLGRAFERWERVGAADNVHAYVRRMLVNEYLDWRRRRIRTTVRADLSMLIEPVADHADRHVEHVALVAELAKLPPKQRAALVLRFYEGLTYPEIAEMLGSGENAVRSNVSRALRSLRIEMSETAADVAAPKPTLITEARS